MWWRRPSSGSVSGAGEEPPATRDVAPDGLDPGRGAELVLSGPKAPAPEHLRNRFLPRAHVLFFARLGIDAVGLLILLVPAFARLARVQLPVAAYWLGALVLHHVAVFLWIGRRGDRVVTFGSLCVDLVALVYLVTVTGGLRSPLMQGQLIYTVFFATIFPKPLAILPPLLTIPLVAKIEQLIGTQMAIRDLMLLAWYFVVNVILVYVVVYLDRREVESYRELDRQQRRQRHLALAEERNRIARDMHDGLGAILSSVVIEAEYLETQLEALRDDVPEAPLRSRCDGLGQELRELRKTSREGMEELRRAVSMMREDFDLVLALEEHCAARTPPEGVEILFSSGGVERPLAPDQQLACYRILQEALSNALAHARARRIDVRLEHGSARATLTIRDDGDGFDPGATVSGHYGLQTMRERAAKSAGELEVRSARGEGTTVRAAFTYRDPLAR